MPEKQKQNLNDQEQTLLSHLTELRDRLLRSVVCVLIIFLALVPFVNDIYTAIASPLIDQIPGGMIATGIITPFLVPFKFGLFAAMYIAMPFLLYQSWAFVAPGLYDNERLFVLPMLLIGSVLFYLGTFFAYFLVFPLVFQFMSLTTPEGVTYFPDIQEYLSFIIKLFFAFGLAFEVPLITILLVKSGFTTPAALAEKRAYIIVGAFAAGMFLTPPDPPSQLMLALPVWLLFELGLVLCKHFVPESEELEEQESG